MITYLVYLAGPIAGISYDDSVDWRRKATLGFHDEPIETLSPMRGKSNLKPEGKIRDSYEEDPMSSRKGITTRDRNDVMRCDLVLAYLRDVDRVSIGTMIELGWADAFRKPVVAVMTEDGVHYHAMVREIAGFVVPSLDDAIEVVCRVLLTDGRIS